MSKQVTRITLAAALLGLGVPNIGQSVDDTVDRQIYQQGLSALKNIIYVQDELKERLEDLVDQERKIGDEKKELRLVMKDIDGVFPKGKENLSVRARGFERRIRDIDRTKEKHLQEAIAYLQKNNPTQEPVIKKPRSNKGVLVGVVVGALVSLAAGFFFWKVVGKNDSKNDDPCNKDRLFIKGIVEFAEKHL